MLRPSTSRRRLLLARVALAVLLLPVSLTGPRLFPCPSCEELDGHYVQHQSWLLTACQNCDGRGVVTDLDALFILGGYRTSDPPQDLFYYPSEDLKPGESTYVAHVFAGLVEQKGNIRIHWPYHPVVHLSLPGLLLALQIVIALLASWFLPIFACAGCPGDSCPRCSGTGSRSARRRWIPESWRSRIWKGTRIAKIGVAILFILFLSAHVGLRACPDCRGWVGGHPGERGPVPRCWRCGNAHGISLWNPLFVDD